MNRRPQRDEPNRVHVRDGESEKSPGKAPIEEEKRADERKEKKSEGREGTDATVSRIREKRWKEDVREKTEVKTIGQ